MSRSGYTDDIDNWALIKWRGAVTSAIKGERGQRLLRDLLAALDAMPDKRLIANELEASGEFCALGVLGKQRGVDMSNLDPENRESVAEAFGIAPALAAEVVYENDESIYEDEWIDIEICGPMRPHYPDWGRHKHSLRVPAKNVEERRWSHMRAWVASKIKEDA